MDNGQLPLELAEIEPFNNPRYIAEADEIVGQRVELLEALWQTLGANTEIVLHNFGRLPNSIVAIFGNVSGRQVGGPATNLGLRNLVRDEPERRRLGYETVMPNGTICRSSSLYLFGSFKEPVGAICVNTDVGALTELRDLADQILTGNMAGTSRPIRSNGPERFYTTVDQAANEVLSETVESAGVPVSLMSKKQKVNIVAELQERGFFLLKGAVELAASALDVTRFTIYSYINECKDNPTPTSN